MEVVNIMARKRKRRTKAAYQELFDDPTCLLPGAEVILFPNGEPKIWIRGPHGTQIAIEGGAGPHGLSVRLDGPAVAAGDYTVQVTDKGHKEMGWHDGAKHISVTQYFHDEESQAFKEEYWHRDGHVPC